MFQFLAEDIIYHLIAKKKLDIDKKDIYVYAMEVILLNGLLVCMSLAASVLGRNMEYFIGFLFFFFPIRTLAGGYHASRSEVCFTVSTLGYIGGMVLSGWLKNYVTNEIMIALFLVSAAILFLYAPLVNPNHPMADYQRKRNRRILWVMLVIDFGLLLFFLKGNCRIALFEVIFVFLSAVLLLVGKLKRMKPTKCEGD